MITEHNKNVYPNKVTCNIKNEDAIHWILKNKMRYVAKELIINCDVMRRLYERGDDVIDLIENDI